MNRDDQSPEELMATLEVGDVVKISTRSGEAYEFVLESIGESGMSGAGITVTYDQIDRIEATRKTSSGDVVKVLGASAALAAIIYYLLIAPWQRLTLL
jgi:DNA-directed RNA polymerase subunit H (RpoH/RPB5)